MSARSEAAAVARRDQLASAFSALADPAWRKVMEVNLDSNLMLMRECHPLLKLAPRGGRVTVIGSKNVPAPGPGAAAYSASKAALNQLARVAALEWGGDNVRINDDRWLDADLANDTVEERFASMTAFLGERAKDWVVETDRLKRVVDADGRVIGIHHNVAERGGRHLDVYCCIVFELENGRIVEQGTHDDLMAILRDNAQKSFIVFCDDLSFDADDTSYKSLKAVLEGGIEGRPDNVIMYATSNRRHLLSRDMMENERSTAINPGETVEEKVSLSERFGVWVSFYPFDQDEYLAIVAQWLGYFKVSGANSDAVRHAALQWALQRGSRSGRVAWQFARDWAGRSRAARGK